MDAYVCNALLVDCCCLSVNVVSLREQILPLSTIVAWAAAKNQKGSRGWQAGNQLQLAIVIVHGIWHSGNDER